MNPEDHHKASQNIKKIGFGIIDVSAVEGENLLRRFVSNFQPNVVKVRNAIFAGTMSSAAMPPLPD